MMRYIDYYFLVLTRKYLFCTAHLQWSDKGEVQSEAVLTCTCTQFDRILVAYCVAIGMFYHM